MKSVKTIKFNSHISSESSHTPQLVSLGNAQCSMELFTEDGTIQRDGDEQIEWYIEYTDERGKLNGDDDVEHIGVSFENRR